MREAKASTFGLWIETHNNKVQTLSLPEDHASKLVIQHDDLGAGRTLQFDVGVDFFAGQEWEQHIQDLQCNITMVNKWCGSIPSSCSGVSAIRKQVWQQKQSHVLCPHVHRAYYR